MNSFLPFLMGIKIALEWACLRVNKKNHHGVITEMVLHLSIVLLTSTKSSRFFPHRENRMLILIQTNNNLSNPDRINLNVSIETTSLNNPERTGVYYVTGNNIGALPSGFSNYGILLCMRSPYSLHPTNSNCVYVQEYTDVYGKHASRSFNNGAWTNWTTTATKDDLENVPTATGPSKKSTVTFYINTLNGKNYIQFFENDIDRGYLLFDVSRNLKS